MELNDAEAIFDLGAFYDDGLCGLQQNNAKAFELWHRAAELGSAEAHYNIGNAYKFGDGMEVDEKKATHYFELAAMRGDACARNNLGVTEVKAGNIYRALKHYMIAVRDGDSNSLNNVKNTYMRGLATKDDYAKALRSYQAYLEEIKSDQRDEAAAANDKHRYYESVY